MIRTFAIVAALFAARTASAQDKVDVFQATKIWPIHIEMTAEEYQAMQPPPNAGGGFGFGFPGQPMPKQPEKKPGERDVHRGVFGTDFPVAHATIRSGDHVAKNVAIRYKGNSTYLAVARNLKRSLKFDVNEFEDGQKFLGLKSFCLHCGAHDPTKIREALAYDIMRAAGTPAPRTAFAEVTLTVPGKYDKELVGFYTFTETVTKPFLQSRFKTDKGLLMKPERIRSLDYLGENWEAYKNTYQPRRDATKDEIARTIAFVKLVNQAPAALLEKEIANHLDIDSFLRYLAATTLVSNLDSFFTNGHNYCLYLHPETNKFHFITWDSDLALGNFPIYGTPEQQADLSLVKPYMENKLADKLLAIPDVKAKYMAVVKDAAKALDKDRVSKVLAELEAVAKPAMERDAAAAKARREGGGGFGPPAGFGQKPVELKWFLEKRAESVAAQLAGKSKGYEPKMAGFGGPGFGPPGGGPAAAVAGALFGGIDGNRDGKLGEAEFQDAMKRFFKEWDKNKDGQLDQQELTEGLQKLMRK